MLRVLPRNYIVVPWCLLIANIDISSVTELFLSLCVLPKTTYVRWHSLGCWLIANILFEWSKWRTVLLVIPRGGWWSSETAFNPLLQRKVIYFSLRRRNSYRREESRSRDNLEVGTWSTRSMILFLGFWSRSDGAGNRVRENIPCDDRCLSAIPHILDKWL